MIDEYRAASEKTEDAIVRVHAVAAALAIMVRNHGGFDVNSDFNNAMHGLHDILISLSNDALRLHCAEFGIVSRASVDA